MKRLDLAAVSGIAALALAFLALPLVATASVVWRRALLPTPPFDESYRTPGGLLLALLVNASRDHPLLFQPTTVARAEARRDDLAALEESVGEVLAATG